MTDAIAKEVRYLARFMEVDETGTLWIGGDGLRNAGNRKDVNRLFELGALTYQGTVIHVNEDYVSLFDRA